MKNDGLDMSKEVVKYVAYNINTNVRELEGALISLLAQSSLNKKEIDLELAKKVHTSRTAIARYESGDYEGYNVGTLIRIARALHKRLKISFSS